MPFELQRFVKVGSSFNAGQLTALVGHNNTPTLEGGPALFTYASDVDTALEIAANNYFVSQIHSFSIGDIIFVNASDENSILEVVSKDVLTLTLTTSVFISGGGSLPVSGIWSPTLLGSSAAGTPAYVSNTGWYQQFGELVNAFFSIELSSKGGMTGSILLSGLPFTSDIWCSGQVDIAENLVNAFPMSLSNNDGVSLFISNAESYGSLLLQDGDISNTTLLSGSITYRMAP